MSSAVLTSKPTFIVWAPVYRDEDAVNRRNAATEAHFANVNKHVQRGHLRVGGFTITPESIGRPIEEQVKTGASFIFHADSVEQVRTYVEEDPFWAANVWDKEKLEIHPIVLPTLTPNESSKP